MRVAFLGLGHMGGSMAVRLIAAGYDVALWNRSPQKCEAVAATAGGGKTHATPAAAVRAAEIVFLCLTDGTAIDALLFGPDGIAGAIAPDATIVDFSTSDPASARRFADRLRGEGGAAWLDCPVSGGAAGAQAGTLAILAGGDAKRLDRVRPVLAHLASSVTHLGDVGAGQAAKLCNQLIVSANLVAISEAIALGRALGVNAARLPEAFAGGFADSRPLQLFGARMAAAIDPGPRGGALKTMAKDVRAINAAAADGALALPLIAMVEALYQRLLDNGLGDEDLPALMRLFENAEGMRNG